MALKELEAKDLARLDPDYLGALGNEGPVNDFAEAQRENNNPTNLYRNLEASSPANVRELLAGPAPMPYGNAQEESKVARSTLEETM